jgi:hypothetical protein
MPRVCASMLSKKQGHGQVQCERHANRPRKTQGIEQGEIKWSNEAGKRNQTKKGREREKNATMRHNAGLCAQYSHGSDQMSYAERLWCMRQHPI